MVSEKRERYVAECADFGEMETDGERLDDPNKIVAEGPDYLRQTVDIGDDVLETVQQEINDGARTIRFPTGQTLTTSTTLTLNPKECHLIVPPSTEIIYSGPDAAVDFRSTNGSIRGGRWSYDGNVGGSEDAVGIRISSDSNNTFVNNGRLYPTVVRDFYAGFEVTSTDGASTLYHRIGFQHLRNNQRGIWFHTESSSEGDGTVNSIPIDGYRVSAGAVSASPTTGITWETNGRDMSAFPIYGLNIEALDRGFDFRGNGSTVGVDMRGGYIESVTDKFVGNKEEVYQDNSRGKHQISLVNMGSSQQRTALHSVTGANAPDAAHYRTDGSATQEGIYWGDGAPRGGFSDAGNLATNVDTANLARTRRATLTVGAGNQTSIKLFDVGSTGIVGTVEISAGSDADSAGFYRLSKIAYNKNADTFREQVVASSGTTGTNTSTTYDSQNSEINLTVDNGTGNFVRCLVDVDSAFTAPARF